MSENFFDKNILESSKTEENYSEIKNYKDLTYHLKKIDGFFSFYCEIDEQRLNQTEIKTLLKMNEVKNFMSEGDKTLLTYFSNKIGPIQTIYRLMNDIEIVLTNLKDSKFKFLLNEKETKVSEEPKAEVAPSEKVTDEEGNERTVDSHKTQYTKLSGPKFTGEKVDL